MNQEWTFSEPAGKPAQLPAAIRRPGFLTAATIVLLILGVIGALAGFINLVSVVFVEKIEQLALEKDEDGNLTPIAKINQANYGIIKRFRVPNLVSGIVQLSIAIVLAYAAYRAFRLFPNSLLTICYVIIGFELLRAGWIIFVAMETNHAVSVAFDQLKQQPGPSGASGHANVESVMAVVRFSQIAGMAVWIGWVLVKVTFLGLVARYLRKENIRQLFTASSV